MLRSVGLSDLITTSTEDYEARLLELAQDRDQLRALKDKLAANRVGSALFDNAQYAADLEDGFFQAHALFTAGKAPRDIHCGAGTRTS